MRKLLSIAAFAFLFTACDESDDPLILPEASQTARYALVFEATWSAETHPTDFPSNPHFSGLIGTTHDESTRLFEVGTLASNGIRVMAETGGKSALRTEIIALESEGKAEFIIDGNGVSDSPGSTSVEFDISQDQPFVSVTTMIAPSPDWFVGVSGITLFEDGDWVESLEIFPNSYDSGTDSGETFVSPNQITEPFVPVFQITDGPLAVDGDVEPLGRFVFTRIE